MENREVIRKANLLRVIHLALCFMMLFTAYFAGQNLMTQIFKQLGYDSLGPICFFTIYGVFAFSCIFSSHFLKKISVKTGFVCGSSAYLSFITIGAITTYCQKYQSDASICSTPSIYALNIVTAAGVGMGASILWLCQATYVNACAYEEIRGVFLGLFFSIFQISQILSGVIAAVVLGTMDQFSFYVVLMIFGTISVTMFTLLKNPVEYGEVFSVEPSKETIKDALFNSIKTIKDPKYRFLFMSISFTGIGVCFYASYLGSIIAGTVNSSEAQVVNQKTGFVFIILALGSISSGVIMGRLADKFDKIKVLIGAMITFETALFLTFIACLKGDYTFALMGGALWGFGDNSLNTLINVIIGSRFQAKSQVFSVSLFFSNVGATFSSICAILVPKEFPLLLVILIAGTMFTLQMLFFYNLFKVERISTENPEEEKLFMEMKELD